ncbi:helix-turn-helix transcriptional regulator [Mycobacteroides abscessus]|uniref:helix-turn-helix domain-containing protein n=1 Tax=Mycobacteroides abscessus TaxID=36809 RepID=UPI003078390A
MRVAIVCGMTTATLPAQGWRPADRFGHRVKLVRAELGITQKEAAERCGVTPREWQNMEDGRTPRRMDLKVRQIAMAFGVDRDWLMWGGELAPEDGADPTGSAATSDKSS